MDIMILLAEELKKKMMYLVIAHILGVMAAKIMEILKHIKQLNHNMQILLQLQEIQVMHIERQKVS